jgi:hypothetical protein
MTAEYQLTFLLYIQYFWFWKINFEGLEYGAQSHDFQFKQLLLFGFFMAICIHIKYPQNWFHYRRIIIQLFQIFHKFKIIKWPFLRTRLYISEFCHKTKRTQIKRPEQLHFGLILFWWVEWILGLCWYWLFSQSWTICSWFWYVFRLLRMK